MPAVVQRNWPTPTRNDVQLQHSSIDLAIAGIYFPFFSEVSYTMTVDPGEARGASPFPMGVTAGEAKANASISVHRIRRERFFNLIDPDRTGVFDKFFPIQVSYSEFGWTETETDSFECRITEIGGDSQAGNSPLSTKLSLYVPGLVIYNGRAPMRGILV